MTVRPLEYGSRVAAFPERHAALCENGDCTARPRAPWDCPHFRSCIASRRLLGHWDRVQFRVESKRSHQDSAVRCRYELGSGIDTDGVTCCRGRLTTERAGQVGTRCEAHRATDCRAEAGVDVPTQSGAEFAILCAVGRRAQPRTRRATDSRPKSLIDGHIENRVVCGSECRSHSRIDPPVGCFRAGSGDSPTAFRDNSRWSNSGSNSPSNLV